MKAFFSQIKLILTLKCGDAERFISDSLDRDLLWYERWALRGHHLCCVPCRQFAKQMRFVRDAFRRVAGGKSSIEPTLPTRLSEESKSKLRAKLRS